MPDGGEPVERAPWVRRAGRRRGGLCAKVMKRGARSRESGVSRSTEGDEARRAVILAWASSAAGWRALWQDGRG